MAESKAKGGRHPVPKSSAKPAPTATTVPSTRARPRLDEFQQANQRPKLSRGQIIASLSAAVVIVVAAWFLSGRLGIDELGRGGINRSYLPEVGEPAPELAMLDSPESGVLLSQFRGQPVWINFWGSWCDPCKVEFPHVQAAYEALAPQGLVLLAISVNETWEQAKRYADTNGGTFPVYNIPSLQVFGETWDNRNFPTHIYIDAAGVIRYISTEVGTTESLIERGEWLLAQPVSATPAAAAMAQPTPPAMIPPNTTTRVRARQGQRRRPPAPTR